MVIKYKSDKGLTLIEILIGIIVSSVMMLAIYTTYSIINTTYGQVVDKASISKSSRDLIEILIKDIRMSGFKYYHGENDKGYPKDTYLDVKGGDVSIAETHDPIVIESDKLGYLRPGDTESDQERKEKIKNNAEKDVCCDRIHIVYDDFDQNDEYQPYKRYKFTYYAKARFGEENEITDGQTTTTRINPRYAIYKSKAKATRGLLVHSLELQIIDSWLLMQRADQTGKHWRSSSWINGITNWFDRQLKQGSRTDIKRLSKRQKQYFSYCVQEMVVPAAPDYDLTAYIQKQKKQQEDGDEIRRLMNYANHTESCVVAYLKYITEHNKLDVDVDWSKIVEHCKVQFETLTPDEVDAVERAVPVLRSVHFCIKNNWYIERS